MKYIHTEKEIPIQKHNLALDLKTFLRGYLLPINITYYIQQEKLTLDETLSINGLLPLFLFNQNEFINSYIQKLNTKEDKQFFIDLEFIYSENSLLDIIVNFHHNLIVTDNNHENKHNFYYDFIQALALNILKTNNYSFINNNELHLDTIYTKYHAVITDLYKKSTDLPIIMPNVEETIIDVTPTEILVETKIKNFTLKKTSKNKKNKKNKNTRKD